jgi:hypothetical protein
MTITCVKAWRKFPKPLDMISTLRNKRQNARRVRTFQIAGVSPTIHTL